MPNMSIDFDVYCAVCGEGLCNCTEVVQNSYQTKIIIKPCPRCIEKAKDEGYCEGYSDANQD